MAWVHARIIVKPTGDVYFSDDSARGFMSPKEFIETYNGNMYIHDNLSWVACDKRHGDLHIDFGEPAA